MYTDRQQPVKAVFQATVQIVKGAYLNRYVFLLQLKLHSAGKDNVLFTNLKSKSIAEKKEQTLKYILEKRH